MSRDDYFADEQTADSVSNDEKCAQMIFPDGHFAFELIRETRAGDRSWQRIDQEYLLMQITKVIPVDHIVTVEKMYISEPLRDTIKETLFVCANTGTSKNYLLFGVHYDKNEKKIDVSSIQKYMLSPDQGMGLNACIAFVEKLEQTTDYCKWAKDFVLNNMPLEEMNLSVRAYNCLKRAGITTVGDMTHMTREDFMKVRNLGKKGTEEIITWFKVRGIEVANQ